MNPIWLDVNYFEMVIRTHEVAMKDYIQIWCTWLPYASEMTMFRLIACSSRIIMSIIKAANKLHRNHGNMNTALQQKYA